MDMHGSQAAGQAAAAVFVGIHDGFFESFFGQRFGDAGPFGQGRSGIDDGVDFVGFDVKVSEVHGMSQRGGSVVTYVRYGEKVYSPVIDKGEADVIISFEQLEAARWVEFLKKDGVIITNTQKMEPMPVITGAAEYPEGLIEKLTAAGAKVDAKDFLALAEEAGSSKAVNIALMGRFSTYFPDITDEQWQDAIEKNVPAKFLELNRKAFELGRNA